jgi:hypothetical protein
VSSSGILLPLLDVFVNHVPCSLEPKIWSSRVPYPLHVYSWSCGDSVVSRPLGCGHSVLSRPLGCGNSVLRFVWFGT